jgi:hypothetical protein
VTAGSLNFLERVEVPPQSASAPAEELDERLATLRWPSRSRGRNCRMAVNDDSMVGEPSLDVSSATGGKKGRDLSVPEL